MSNRYLEDGDNTVMPMTADDRVADQTKPTNSSAAERNQHMEDKNDVEQPKISNMDFSHHPKPNNKSKPMSNPCLVVPMTTEPDSALNSASYQSKTFEAPSLSVEEKDTLKSQYVKSSGASTLWEHRQHVMAEAEKQFREEKQQEDEYLAASNGVSKLHSRLLNFYLQTAI